MYDRPWPSIGPSEPDTVPRRSDLQTARSSSLLFLAGAILLPVASVLHPAPSPSEEWEAGNASMLADGVFIPAHLLELASLVMLLAAMVMIARSPTVRRLVAMRTALIAVAGALSIAAVGQVFFILAGTQADQMLVGGSTPFFETHLILQAIAQPILGLGLATLAVLDARRSPRWTWIPATIGVIGGLLGASFGPMLAITRDLSYAVLGAGWALIGIWTLVAALRRLVNVRRGINVAVT